MELALIPRGWTADARVSADVCRELASLLSNLVSPLTGSPGNRLVITQCDDHTYCCDSNCNCSSGIGTISLEGAPSPFTTIGIATTA